MQELIALRQGSEQLCLIEVELEGEHIRGTGLVTSDSIETNVASSITCKSQDQLLFCCAEARYAVKRFVQRSNIVAEGSKFIAAQIGWKASSETAGGD